jgi:hypothetical protein
MSSAPAISRALKAGALLACLCALVPACGGLGPKSPVGGHINIIARSLRATPTTWVRFTLQSPTVLDNPLTIPMLVEGDQSSTFIRNLPVANDYLLTADALSSDNVIVAHGAVTAVSIVSGKTTQVIVYLNPVINPPSFGNSSPIVDAILLSADTVVPGGQIALTGTAHDPDPGQTATLAFSWLPEAACGTMDGVGRLPGLDVDHPSQSLATWTAPQVPRICQITLTVQDILGLVTSASFVVRVGGAVGAATISTVFNNVPEILAITSTPPQLAPDGPTSGFVEVIATDPDGDNLGFSWTSDPNAPCTVEFKSPSEKSSEFTATPTRADATYCTFLVTVNDGVWSDTGLKKGAVSVGFDLAIAPPLVAQHTPDFGITYQSHDTAQGGTVAWFGAIAYDPEGGILSYAWSASSGSPPEPTTPTLLGLSPSFTAAATWTVPDGAENLPSDLVVTVTATSSVSNLQSARTFTLKPANLP